MLFFIRQYMKMRGFAEFFGDFPSHLHRFVSHRHMMKG